MLKNLITALIFAAAQGIAYNDIKNAFSDEYTEREIRTAINEIRDEYSGDKGILLIEFNNKYQFQTNPKYGKKLADVLQPIKEHQLSNTTLQTLAIIAYRQPITKAEIEEIRNGVSSDYALDVLRRAELIDVVGQKQALGNPNLYGTTDKFLKRFQLKELSELPDYETLLNSINVGDKFNVISNKLYEIKGDIIHSGEEDFLVGPEDDDPEYLKGEDFVVVGSSKSKKEDF